MATLVTPFDPFTTQYYQTMAATSTVGSAIRSGASYLSIAKDFWDVSRKLKSLIKLLDTVETADPKTLTKIVSDLAQLHKNVASLLVMPGIKRLMNRTLTAGSIISVQKGQEDLFDRIEHLAMSLDPEMLASCEEALREFQAGETVSLESLLK